MIGSRSRRLFAASVLLLPVAWACGTDYAGVMADAGVPDASTDATETPEASPEVDGSSGPATLLPCNLAAPFGTPVAIAGNVNTSAGEDGASFTLDELEIVFATTPSRFDGGSGDYELYGATRTNAADPFLNASRIGGPIASTDVEDWPSFTPDALGIVFTSDRNGNYDLFLATRASRASGFVTAATLLTGVSTTQWREQTGFVQADGDHLWYATNAPAADGASTGLKLMVATKNHLAAVFDSPGVPVDGTDLDGAETDEDSPIVTGDGLTLYFARTFATGASREIYVAHRATATAAFDTPVSATELNGPSTDRPTWISPDGCRILIASSRSGGAGSNDVYLATKPR